MTGQYADVNGTCRSCGTNCLACTNATNCTQCNPSYYLSNGQCSSTCQNNQYNFTIQVYTNTTNTTSKICKDCLSPCDMCISNTSCTHCIQGYYLNANKSCVDNCGDGYYGKQ